LNEICSGFPHLHDFSASRSVSNKCSIADGSVGLRGEHFKIHLLKHFVCDGEKLRTKNENRLANKPDEKGTPENGWE
jgi:hypothetical protein